MTINLWMGLIVLCCHLLLCIYRQCLAGTLIHINLAMRMHSRMTLKLQPMKKNRLHIAIFTSRTVVKGTQQCLEPKGD